MSETPQKKSRGRAAARAIVVGILALWAVASIAPSISLLWDPPGTLGFTADYDGHIMSVEPGSPAAATGLAIRDKVNLAATAFRYRRYVGQYPGGYSFVKVDSAVTLSVLHNGELRRVTLLPVPLQLTPLDKALVVVRLLGGLLFIVIAAGLVLLRPSPMTWGFFFYALAVNPGSNGLYFALLPAKLFVVARILYNVEIAVGYAGFLMFALRFPHDVARGWRSTVERLLPYLIALLVARAIYAGIAALVLGVPSEVLAVAGWSASALMYFSGLGCFVATYLESPGEARQRIKWVIVGFAVGFPAFVIAYSFGGTELLPPNRFWAYEALTSLNALVPLTVGYAVFRHRVIDVSFVISRALVYALLTSLLVAIFSLIDYVLSAQLEAARAATVVEIGTALALGFWLDALQRRANAIVDSVFFRSRRAAERRLERSTAALPFAQSAKTVDEIVVWEPVEAFGLAAAALFRKTDGAAYARACDIGWDANDMAELGPDDPIVLNAQAARAPVRIAEIHWTRKDLPHGSARPIVAFPLLVRQDLLGVAFYSAHAAGQDLDADEIGVLRALTDAAAYAYDHLDAERLRRENAELTARLAT